jgi:hypothetical protein
MLLWRALRADRVPAGEKSYHRLNFCFGSSRKKRLEPLIDPGIKRIDLLQFPGIDFDRYAPAVLGIGLTLDQAGLLQAIEHHRDPSGRQTGAGSQFAGRGWPEQLQEI